MEISIRKYSFFEKTKYTIQDMLTFIREFLLGSSLKKCSLNSGITYGHTAVDYASFIREIFKQYVHDMLENTKLSGRIELDESLFGRKCKNNRGKRKGHQIWIFGNLFYDIFKMSTKSEYILLNILLHYL